MGKAKAAPRRRSRSTSRAPYLTTNTTQSGNRTYRYVVVRYDEVDESGVRSSKSLVSLGREEDVDPKKARSLADLMRDFVRRDSTTTMEELKAALGAAKTKLRVICSRQFGLRLLVEQAFAELGYKVALEEIDQETRRKFAIEQLVFGMVLQQIVWPGSKLRAAERLAEVVFYPEGEGMAVHHYYRALDELSERGDRIEAALRAALKSQGLTFKTSGLDTTGSYFETDYDDVEWKEIAETPDPKRKVKPVVNDPPLRMRGYSRDHRPNKPQVVVQQVVSEGYVIHHDTHPGNTSDQTLLAGTVEKLAGLGLTDDVIWTADAGMNTKRAREALAYEDVDFVLGEGRSRTKVVRQILSCGGRYRDCLENEDLAYRAHRREGRLFVVRLNRAERKRELKQIDRHLKKLETTLAKSDSLESKTNLKLLASKTYSRYLKRSRRRRARLELDNRAIAKARKLAGKSVISTSLVGLKPSLVDALYRLQFGVEDAFRTSKSELDLRPIRHRRSNRIKAHVLVQVMALNVVRHLQRKTGMRLPKIRDFVASLTVQQVDFGGASYWQCVELSEKQDEIFSLLGYDRPLPRFSARVAR